MKKYAAALMIVALAVTLLLGFALAEDSEAQQMLDEIFGFVDERSAEEMLDYFFGELTLNTPTPSPEPPPTPVPTAAPERKVETAASGYPLIIDDSIGLLSEEERLQLRAYMEPLTKYGAVAFYTTNDPMSADDEAMEYFKEHIHPSRSYNGVVFMIDMAPRKIYIFSRGELEKMITRSDAYAITSDISYMATQKEYFACAREAFVRIGNSLEGREPLSPTRVICTLVMSIALGLLAAHRFAAMRSIQPAVEPIEMTDIRNLKNSCQILTLGESKLISVETRKVQNSSSCSSCSSCSGGGSCGGGSGCSSCSSCGSGGGDSF